MTLCVRLRYAEKGFVCFDLKQTFSSTLTLTAAWYEFNLLQRTNRQRHKMAPHSSSQGNPLRTYLPQFQVSLLPHDKLPLFYYSIPVL